MVDEQLLGGLARIVGAKNVLASEPMSAHTTFGIGGPARAMVVPQDNAQVRAVMAACRKAGVPVRVLGCGSDLLVADEGLACVVMLMTSLDSVALGGKPGCLMVGAGATNARVAEFACEQGLAGFEFASGIPGTIGGAAIMNAGAYDGEFRDVCVSMTCLDANLDTVEVSRDQADWSYRHSMMDDQGMIVLSAVLQLRADDPAAIRARMDDLQQRRQAKQPLDLPSAGSTFKRPAGYYAGKLIQDAGMQGACVGGAQVSPKHAGFVVNAGGATASDVLALIARVQEQVLESQGVQLQPEVRFWR